METELTSQERVAIWREKSANGTITIEEMKQALAFLRENREASISTSKAKKAKASPSGADLLRSLEDLM